MSQSGTSAADNDALELSEGKFVVTADNLRKLAQRAADKNNTLQPGVLVADYEATDGSTKRTNFLRYLDVDTDRRDPSIDNYEWPEGMEPKGTVLGFRDKDGQYFRAYQNGGVQNIFPSSAPPSVQSVQLDRVEITASRELSSEYVPFEGAYPVRANAPLPDQRSFATASAMGEFDGFVTFNPAGRALKGAGGAALDAWFALPRLGIGIGNLARDAWGYTAYAIAPSRSVLTGQPFDYQPKSGLIQSFQQNGAAGTVGMGISGLVRNAPGIGLVVALGAPNRDWGSVGAQTFNAAISTTALRARGGVGVGVAPAPVWAACFLPGTLVHTIGGTKLIEQIEPGDMVAARNQYNQQTQWRPVLQVFVSKDKDVVHVQIEHPGGEREVISATTEHPFFVTGQGWRGANALQPGDSLELLDGGQSKVVEVSADTNGKHVVYNFEVADDHTYFVGERGVWVHNTSSVSDALLEVQAARLAQQAKPTPIDPRVVTYRPTISGAENHHGVLDVWATHNVPGYVSRAAASPAVALGPGEHAATKAVYRDWLTQNYGRPVGVKVDWTQVSPREAFNLSERMFDAAKVTQTIRDDYYRALNRYVYGGQQ